MKKLLCRITETHAGIFVSLMRLLIAFIFIKAGGGKLFGWFGGFGIEGVTGFFTKLGIPYPELNAYLVGGTEFFGGILMALGLLTRLVSIPFCVIMLTAILTAHKDGDFYYPLMIFAACLALIDVGAGVLSLDKLIGKNRSSLQ